MAGTTGSYNLSGERKKNCQMGQNLSITCCLFSTAIHSFTAPMKVTVSARWGPTVSVISTVNQWIQRGVVTGGTREAQVGFIPDFPNREAACLASHKKVWNAPSLRSASALLRLALLRRNLVLCENTFFGCQEVKNNWKPQFYLLVRLPCCCVLFMILRRHLASVHHIFVGNCSMSGCFMDQFSSSCSL